MTHEFKAFPKIPRLYKDIVVTEKIDGTNAVIYIADDGINLLAGSRNRWITPENDNFGFAKWVAENKSDLLALGPGYHFGEWWGCGIQRGYGLKERRFSLFNVIRWKDKSLPPILELVPLIGITSSFSEAIVIGKDSLAKGSLASPGFTNPEGIIMYHTAANQLFKYTFDGDHHKEIK